MVTEGLATQENAAESHSQEREFTQLEQWCLGRGWDPSKPDDAETWLGKGLDKPKKIDADYQREKKKAEQLEKKVTSLIESNERLMGQLTEAQADRFKQQQESLERKFEQAVEDGDVQEARKIQGQLFELRAKLQGKVDSGKKETDETPKMDGKKLPVTDPVFDKFIDENPWYEEDLELQSAADSISHELRDQFPYLFGIRLLNRVKERLIKEYPEKFESEERSDGDGDGEKKPTKPKTAPDVGRGYPGSSGQYGKKMTYNDLSNSDKAHCNHYVKQQVVEKGMKREDAVKKYLELYAKE